MKTTKKIAAPALKVGDQVRLLKATRHNMIPAGAIGTVEEIRENGSQYTNGVSVRFPCEPHPTILRMFPDAERTMRCLFPTVAVARSLVKV